MYPEVSSNAGAFWKIWPTATNLHASYNESNVQAQIKRTITQCSFTFNLSLHTLFIGVSCKTFHQKKLPLPKNQ